MSNTRLEYLLAKELDGEMTLLEREELDRLARIEPAVRREREAWHRVERTLIERAESTPRIDPVRLTARVMSSKTPRTRESFLRLPSLRWMLAASTIVALGAVALTRETTEVPVAPQRPRVSRMTVVPRAPVDIMLEGADTEDDDLVEIRF